MNDELGMMNTDRDAAPHSSFIIHHSSLKMPDLIISDIMMPVMDGFQLLEKLKGDDRWRHIPVVMLTARADMRDKLRALRIGVDDYVLKPFEEDELLARVENLLSNYGRRSTVDGGRWAVSGGCPSSCRPPSTVHLSLRRNKHGWRILKNW